MPIFYQQDIDDDTRIAIWKIEEEADFFLKKVQPQRNVSHPHKNLQHLAGRYLLRHLFPDFPVELILIADTRKPYLENEAYHFSISHCGDFAAAIVSRTCRIGLDAELYSEKIERIRHKFLTEKELELIKGKSIFSNEVYSDSQIESYGISSLGLTAVTQPIPEPMPVFPSNQLQIFKLTSAWSCKESVFKWYGKGGVDFKNHMEIKASFPYDETAKEQETIILFKKNEELFLHLHSIFFDELCLSYVIT